MKGVSATGTGDDCTRAEFLSVSLLTDSKNGGKLADFEENRPIWFSSVFKNGSAKYDFFKKIMKIRVFLLTKNDGWNK
jgi:hypothetical protein